MTSIKYQLENLKASFLCTEKGIQREREFGPETRPVAILARPGFKMNHLALLVINNNEQPVRYLIFHLFFYWRVYSAIFIYCLYTSSASRVATARTLWTNSYNDYIKNNSNFPRHVGISSKHCGSFSRSH